jgi:hypothetical protein
MKRLFHFIIFLLSSYSFCQSKNQDTLFLFKELNFGNAQSIFIDLNNKSKFYQELNNFEFDKAISYQYSLHFLKEQSIKISKQELKIPSKNWISIKKYRGNYYVYKPCDSLFQNKKSINDSTFIDFTSEGPIVNSIIAQKNNSSSVYQFELSGIYHKERTLTIYMLDFKKGIALFETSDYHSEEKEYELFVAAEKMYLYPIIVNQCYYHKQHEFFFDTPDFKQILLQVKNKKG